MSQTLSAAFAVLAALLGLSLAALGWQGSVAPEGGALLLRSAMAIIPTIIVAVYIYKARQWLSHRKFGLANGAALCMTALSIGTYIYLYSLGI